MNIVKVSVESLDGKQNILYDCDKNISLEDNIIKLLAKFEMPTKTHAYGLKLVQTNNGNVVDMYVTEENFDDIKDGYFLKIVYSVSHQVNTIFLVLEKGDRKTCFDNLSHLYYDEGFIKELVKQEKHNVLINFFVNQSDVTNEETTVCLLSIIHLFKMGFIESIDATLFDRLMMILQQDSEFNTIQIKFTLSLLHKIMLSKNANMDEWKFKMMNCIQLQHLTPYIRIRQENLQYFAILLINSFIRNSTGLQRLQLIKGINYKQTRADIFNYVILNEDKTFAELDDDTKYELYVFQTYLLSLYTDALTSKVELDKRRKKDFELDHQHQTFADRLTTMIEFENYVSKMKSIDSSTDGRKTRSTDTYSICSMDEILRQSQIDISEDTHVEISFLTLGSLSYYKKYHAKNFHQTQIDETFFGPGIFVTSESVVKILATILQIGKEPGSNKLKHTFQPTIFKSNTKIPFFYELFSRTIWILSKTKNEMKNCSVPEYFKLWRVLEKQVEMVLEKRPENFKMLTDLLLRTNYEAVKQRWQEENHEEFKRLLKYNPCIQELRKRYLKTNEELVKEQRMNFLISGSVFYRVNEHKKIDHCFMELLKNKKQLLSYEYDERLKKKRGEPNIITIANITHLVEGKACPHKVNSITKDNRLLFSLIIDSSTYVNIIAKDFKEGSYWLDGFHILLDKETRSDFYDRELQELVTMDLSLHLIELQNVKLPKKPPPIPTPPNLIEKPPIPLKSPGLRMLKLKKTNGKEPVTIKV